MNMAEEEFRRTYNAEEIFEDIPGDSEHILMNIPQEIRDKMGWVEGDVLIVTASDGVITISKKGD